MDTFTVIQDDPKDAGAIPLVLVHDGGGTIFNYCLLDPIRRHLYGIQYPHWESGEDFQGGLAGLAQFYCNLIRERVPKGRILLGGWSFGSLAALEMSHQLIVDGGYDVVGIIMIDPPPPPSITSGRTGIPTRDLHSVTSGLRANVRDNILRAMEITAAMTRSWTPPKWENGSACPPAVLLRADQPVPVSRELQGTASVDLARQDGRSGWGTYEPLKIKAVIDIVGHHHFDIFKLDTIDEITKYIVDACEVLTP